MGITIKQTIFEPVPAGKYLAKIAGFEEDDGQHGPFLKIRFEFQLDEGGETRSLIGLASRKFSTTSKLHKWTEAAFGGGPIDRSYTFNSDDLLGRYVYINVVEEVDETRVFNRITSLSPFEQQSRVSTPPPPPEF
jgi:hypothetical protein